jgi:4-oxalocrotonate tautomerase
MPYVHMQITREGVTLDQKEALIKGVTDLLVEVLNKKPAHTFVVIEEVDTDNWGIAGITVTNVREQEKRLRSKGAR